MFVKDVTKNKEGNQHKERSTDDFKKKKNRQGGSMFEHISLNYKHIWQISM